MGNEMIVERPSNVVPRDTSKAIKARSVGKLPYAADE